VANDTPDEQPAANDDAFEGEEGSGERLVRRGSSASPGVGIGPAYVIDRRRVHVPHTHIEKEIVDDEVVRFREALRATHDHLESVKSRLAHGEHRQILKAQQMMLRDPDFSQHAEKLISDELINAEWAVAKSGDEIRETFSKIEDEYLAERQFDVVFLTEQVLRNLLGENPDELTPPEGAVIVAHDLSPADTAALHDHPVAAIITEEGGPTSHTAITARALEIPAVVGVDGLIAEVETGDMVVVDAVHGQIIVHPAEAELIHFRSEAADYKAFEAKVNRERALPGITQDGRRIYLRANVALEGELDSAVSHGAEGVGLYRTEFMYMNRDAPPREEEHYRVAKRVLARCAPYPVTMRTFDLGSDKTSKLLPASGEEANPAMGLRSLRLALRERDLFLAQLRGLLRAGLHGPLRIMLPLVSGPHELALALEAVDEARSQLEEAGMAFAEDTEVGIMVEVPSAAIIADLLAEQVDFISIGTNDLIQYTLAIDRENDEVNYLYEPMHPAILRLIEMVATACKGAGISVSLCGEMASDPLFTWVLVGLGVEELSMHPAAIPVVKNVVRSSSMAEMQALATSVMAARTSTDIRRLVREALEERFPEHLRHRATTGEEQED